MSNSTTPSFSPRVTAVGQVYDYVEREISLGRERITIYGFRFVPEGGEGIPIETSIILPYRKDHSDFNGRTLRIVYLKESDRVFKNEAIDITILAGANAGFHDSVDARLFGLWLGVPLGIAIAVFGLLGLRFYVTDEMESAASDADKN